MEQAGTGGSSFEAETADSSAGGSVRPDRPLRDLPSQSDTPDQPDLPDSPELPDVPDELPPEKVAPLPDVVLSTLIHWKGSHSSVVVAPLEAERGPFELADSPVSITFSPGGSRFAYVHYLQLFVVDSWPPKPRALDTGDLALEPVWLDESRLLVTTNRTLELLDVTTGERETLFVNDPETSETGYPSPYLVRPSPDGRWVVFGRDGGSQQALLLNLEPPRGEPVFLLSAENGFDSGSFDWAPDSEHLALSVRHSWGLLGYTISTKDSVGDLLPFTIPLDETSNVTTFEWSPSGDALHYHYHRQFYQGEDPVTLTDEARLYLVDTSEDAPKPSELLSSFAEPSWPSPGTWSPKSDRVAFSIESVGTPTPQSALYTSDANAPAQPVKQHSGEFESVSQPAWASDGGTLYFVANPAGGTAHLYASKLDGSAVAVSSDSEDVSNLFVSPLPGCVAYTRLTPEPSLAVVSESAETLSEVRAPEHARVTYPANDAVAWVSDASGVRGLVYVTRSSSTEGLAWVEVNDCVPGTPEFLIAPDSQTIDPPSVSSTPPSEHGR